jgi:hypothetical protein
MSPSHAPESMLINEADPVLASFEQPVQKRIRFPSVLKKSSQRAAWSSLLLPFQAPL